MGKGDMARQMAAAPLSGDNGAAEVPQGESGKGGESGPVTLDSPEPDNGNRYDRLFEAVTFSPADGDRVFEDERRGIKSKKVANALVVLAGGFATIPGTVYARKPKSGPTYVEVTFIGNQRQTAVQPVDEKSKAELAEWRHNAATRYVAWRKAQGIGATKAPAASVELEDVNF